MTDLVLIHGAGGTRAELSPLAKAIGPDIRRWGFDLIGHSGRPLPDDYGVAAAGDDLIRQMDRVNVDRTFLFGYSFGGLIALYMTHAYPDRVLGCCSLAAKYVYDAPTVQQLLYILSPERQARLGVIVPPWVHEVHGRHRELLQRVDGSDLTITEERLRALLRPVLILNGAQDGLVTADEAKRMADLIPKGQLTLFNGSAHPFSSVPVDAVAERIRAFIAEVEAADQPTDGQLAAAAS